MLATIGRALKPVAQFGRIRYPVGRLAASGAWFHIFLLIEFRSRVRVMSEWMWYYLTFKPGARIIYTRLRQSYEEERTSPSRSAGSDSKE